MREIELTPGQLNKWGELERLQPLTKAWPSSHLESDGLIRQLQDEGIRIQDSDQASAAGHH